MKSQNQTLLVTLAIVFAVALALAVSLICLTSAGTAILTDPPDESDSTVVVSAPETLHPVTVSDRKGLLFERLGNGVCRLAGIGGCTDACVSIPETSPDGDAVVSVAPHAFEGCATVVALQIPASVTEIGACAFADCPNLAYISVSPQNPAYRDDAGVLCTSDGKRILLYPPMRADASYALSADVLAIDEMAFYRCAFLSSVRYSGSAEAWEQIAIGAKNYSLTAASKQFLGEAQP